MKSHEEKELEKQRKWDGSSADKPKSITNNG